MIGTTHAIVWAVALSLPYLLDSHHGLSHHHENEGHEDALQNLNAITNILWIGPFYLNAYVLVPRLFYLRRYLSYAFSIILAFAAAMLVHILLFEYVFTLPHFRLSGATFFLLPAFILTIAISTAFRLVSDKMKADQQAQARQEENLKTELSFLRSQINPHFIFNVLNNLVALEQLKSEELVPTILKLSALMQYMLYEADEERVALTREMEYLRSYIDLQRQRFGEKVPVHVELEEPDGFYDIEPMLLIPFVENAFKHGVGLIEQPAIHISLAVKAGFLYFSVRNRFNPRSEEVKDKTSGIGLSNVRRRLSLLYGTQQELAITREDNWFIVSLKLKLH